MAFWPTSKLNTRWAVQGRDEIVAVLKEVLGDEFEQSDEKKHAVEFYFKNPKQLDVPEGIRVTNGRRKDHCALTFSVVGNGYTPVIEMIDIHLADPESIPKIVAFVDRYFRGPNPIPLPDNRVEPCT